MTNCSSLSATGVGVWQGSMFFFFFFYETPSLAVSARLRRGHRVLPVRDSSRDTRDGTQKTNLRWKVRVSRTSAQHFDVSQCSGVVRHLWLHGTPENQLKLLLYSCISKRRSLCMLKATFILRIWESMLIHLLHQVPPTDAELVAVFTPNR